VTSASNMPWRRQPEPEPEAEGDIEDRSWQGRGRVVTSFCRCGAAGGGHTSTGLLGAGGAAEHGAAGGGRCGRAWA
jgi:hypothetical protein